MTPAEFLVAMQAAAVIKDTENAHVKMDDLMCGLLRELGFDAGIEVFERAYKWYA